MQCANCNIPFMALMPLKYSEPTQFYSQNYVQSLKSNFKLEF